MKLIVVGGVAGGASAAARARRLNEDAEIIMIERGEFISFANCGLPYHVGNVISERSDLLVMTPENFRKRTNIDVRTLQEVAAINRDKKTVSIKNLNSGKTYEESYDKLILSTGSSPIRPPIPGADDPDVMQLWTIPDMDRILSRVKEGAKRAVVVGGGFIGLEIAENLRKRDLDVTLVELLPQVLPTLDHEMARPLADEMRRNGIKLLLGSKVTEIHRPSIDETCCKELHLVLDNGDEFEADLVVMSVGVRPNSEIAETAGLELAERKGIVVDEHMTTSDPNIYAVGDVVSTKDLVYAEPAQIPLAGPANRQGRIAAENIFGRDTSYRGTLGTSVVKVFKHSAASSGWTEKRLKNARKPFKKIYLHPQSNASYYPGAREMALKLLFDDDGKILGVQAVGEKGVDKRVDVVATAMRGDMTVYDLEELELAYAPPYGSAKDPVNFAGMIAANVLRGDTTLVHADEIPDDVFLLDIREPAENELGAIPGSTLIPLGQLRDRLEEIPKDKKVLVYCRVGLRGYLAERILKQHGIDSANLSGGWFTHKLFNTEEEQPEPTDPQEDTTTEAKEEDVDMTDKNADRHLDVSTMQCPGPVVRLRQELEDMKPGEVVEIKAIPSFETDLRAWSKSAGHKVLSVEPQGDNLVAKVQKSSGTELSSCGSAPAANVPDSAAIVVFSNDLDKVMAAFIIATGMATLGCKVSMFFTFWGLNVLRKERSPSVVKDLLSKMFGMMMPKGARKLALSKMHMMGMGTAMMKYVMGQKNVSSLPDLISKSRELGVKFIACDMAMNVMGLQRQELLDEVDDVAGVAAFASLAKESGTTLFI